MLLVVVSSMTVNSEAQALIQLVTLEKPKIDGKLRV
jgi:hypothetical protein